MIRILYATKGILNLLKKFLKFKKDKKYKIGVDILKFILINAYRNQLQRHQSILMKHTHYLRNSFTFSALTSSFELNAKEIIKYIFVSREDHFRIM